MKVSILGDRKDKISAVRAAGAWERPFAASPLHVHVVHVAAYIGTKHLLIKWPLCHRCMNFEPRARREEEFLE